ncbi:DNA polymerase III, delta subunit [Cyclonatronum proteinivorum]|uniref:DNA polymerase III subunit delta n=1 Tax=Cyclonatronum proteinivorum TaxID=1457365 RepID=A0A345UKE6_9BACT|nr:DNA polymerase III subunit delta [Cyclonatronum proteinivorum]AXJ00948.1 DNA polymerase III, delta subunit [Cyclonatronum proteinivorum]
MAKRSNNVSPQQEFARIIQELDSGTFKPVYFLCGDEPFFIDRIQEKIDSLIPEHSRVFDYEILYGATHDPADILSTAKSYPIGGERRFVFVRDFMQCTEKKVLKDNTSVKPQAGLELFLPYFENPLESTVLVLIDTQKPAGNTRFGKALSKSPNCELFVSSAPTEKEILDWIELWAKQEYKKKIEPDAIIALYQLVGNKLHELSKELEKVCGFAGKRERITRLDVKSVVKNTKEYTAFDLTNALSARDAKRTLYIAERLLQDADKDTGEIFGMISLIYGNFTILWSILRYSAKGESHADIAARLNVNRYRFNYLVKDASNYRASEMPLIFEAILDADRAVKGYSKLDAKAVFILMLKRILA